MHCPEKEAFKQNRRNNLCLKLSKYMLKDIQTAWSLKVSVVGAVSLLLGAITQMDKGGTVVKTEARLSWTMVVSGIRINQLIWSD